MRDHPGHLSLGVDGGLEEVEAGSADISGQGSFPSPVLPLSYLRGY